MPVRTLNYTNRIKIRRDDARITVRQDNNGIRFDAGLSLSDYELPPDSHIFVEAYRQTQYMRFDFGKAAGVRAPEDRQLKDFDSAEGVLFRVKVVTTSDPHGLLLAEADQIRPRKSTDEDQDIVPLLPVRPSSDLGEEIWALEFDAQDTRIMINASLGDWRAVAKDPLFICLVYPSALRSILRRILKEGWTDYEDTEDWRSRWLRFSLNLPGIGEPPGDSENDDDIDEWVQCVATAFCARQGIRSIYDRYWTGGQRQ